MIRNFRFLYRYCYGMIRSKKWDHDNETVSSLFTKRAIKYPKSLCIICEGKSWTFEEVFISVCIHITFLKMYHTIY